MKSPWSWCAPALIPVCLLCCLASLAAHRAWLPALGSAQALLAQARGEARSAQAALDELDRQARPAVASAARAASVERQLVTVASRLRAAAVDGAITLDALAATATTGGASTPVPVGTVARPLPMTDGRLRAAAVSVRGRFSHLEGLLALVEHLRLHPVALIAFSATGQRFELHLWVIGT